MSRFCDNSASICWRLRIPHFLPPTPKRLFFTPYPKSAKSFLSCSSDPLHSNAIFSLHETGLGDRESGKSIFIIYSRDSCSIRLTPRVWTSGITLQPSVLTAYPRSVASRMKISRASSFASNSHASPLKVACVSSHGRESASSSSFIAS